jgi:hypothetical protein
MSEDELIIDEFNFSEHFFDVRKHRPKLGQVMAVYRATAEFADGDLKRDIIYLLWKTDKIEECVKMLDKLGSMERGDALRILRGMAEDLAAGKHSDEVAKKPHKYLFQAYYYTDPDNIPEDSLNWSVVKLHTPEEIVEQVGEYEIRSKIVVPEDETGISEEELTEIKDSWKNEE